MNSRKNSRQKSLIIVMLIGILAVLLCGCKAATVPVAETAAKETTAVAAQSEPQSESAVYQSPDGWEIEYEPECFKVDDADGKTRFTCTLEDTGADYFEISYAKGKMPKELLYEQIADIDDSRVSRYEGRFGGLEDDWSYTYTVKPAQGGDIYEQYDAIEHNGGTLLIHSAYKMEKDEDKAEIINDTMADTMSTLRFTSHEPQQEYSHVPGTYERTYKEEIEGKEETVTDRIVLNANHTGTMNFQDEVPLIWSSWELIVNDGADRYEYTVEGDSLMVKMGEDWVNFDRVNK